MQLDEAKEILKNAGYITEATDIDLTPDEETKFIDELKQRYRGVRLTKNKGIKITVSWDIPVYVRIWKIDGKYHCNCDYVTPDGYLHDVIGGSCKSKTIEGLMKKLEEKVDDIIKECYNRY